MGVCSPTASRSSAFCGKVAQPVEPTDDVLALSAGDGRVHPAPPDLDHAGALAPIQ